MRLLLETGLSNAAAAALLAVAAAAVSRACRRPALTHGLWLLVLLKLVTPPLVRVPVPSPLAEKPPEIARADSASADWIPAPWAPAAGGEAPLDPLLLAREPAPPAEPVPPPSVDAAAAPAAVAPALPGWEAVLIYVWLAGSLAWLAWTAYHLFRFQRLLRFVRPGSPELQERVAELARRLGLKKSPALWLVPASISPMVWAPAGAPRLLFPARLLERLDPEQRDTLLVHELAHLRRRDHWVRRLELAAVALFWWHPVVWWARREIHEAEEQCCDAWVVWALAGAGRAYALALLQTVDFFSHARPTLPATASGVGQVPHLRRRLTMIMQGRTPRSLSWVGCCALLGVGLGMLPLLPVQAQPPARSQPPRTSSGSGDDRDEQIETLRKAIRVLEEQKKTDQRRPSDGEAGMWRFWTRAEGDSSKADPEEVKKAQAELEKAGRELTAKEREAQEARQRFHAAMSRLSKLQGGRFSMAPAPRPGQPGQPTMPPAQEAPRYFPPAAVSRPREPGGRDLEQRLDRVLREVEDLRREIRRGGASGVVSPAEPASAPPRGPGAGPSVRPSGPGGPPASRRPAPAATPPPPAVPAPPPLAVPEER